MRIFTEISDHDVSGVAPGGRITRTDSTPEVGDLTVTNGQFIFQVPEGAAVVVDTDSFYFPQSNTDSISSRTAAEFLVRYPMYENILYNFYLETSDVTSFDVDIAAPEPTAGNTTPVLPTTLIPANNKPPRCLIGSAAGPAVGMVPNSLAILPRSSPTSRAAPVYGSLVTAQIDLWAYNPMYIDVDAAPLTMPGAYFTIAGFTLTGMLGARTSGSDDFDASVATTDLMATEIAAAINDAANSFASFITATAVGSRVELRLVDSTLTTITLSVSATLPVDAFSIQEAHPGTDEVMLWWKIAKMNTSEDRVSSGEGASEGENTPALRSLVEIDQEDSDLLVYASVDNGASWYRVYYLEPIDLVDAGIDLRIAFLNVGTDRIYMLGFCTLFPDLPAPV